MEARERRTSLEYLPVYGRIRLYHCGDGSNHLGYMGQEAEEVRTRNERRQRRQERFWTGMVILFGCLVFWLGAAVGIQVAGL